MRSITYYAVKLSKISYRGYGGKHNISFLFHSYNNSTSYIEGGISILEMLKNKRIYL